MTGGGWGRLRAWEGVGFPRPPRRDSRLRGNDVGGGGNDVGGWGYDGLPRACAHEFPPHSAALCCIVSIPVDGGRGRIDD